MIEKCSYCGDIHETGDGEFTYDGLPIKVCPMVHPTHPIIWNPKDWQRVVDDTPINLTNSHNPSTSNQDNS